MEEKRQVGKVWLVGGGTGDFGLMTQKGLDVLEQAEVVVFDALVSLEILAKLPEKAELIDAGKRSHNHRIPQERINEILLEKALEGKRVVRLKGGDPFVFGRGGEELELLAEHGIPFEVVPGITSSIAVAAYNGIPVTHRDFTSSFHVITGHKKKNGKLDIDFEALVRLDATLVFLMGVAALELICSRLLEEGMAPDTPAAILERGTTCRQKRAVSTVSGLVEEAKRIGIQSPAVIVVGKVCTLEQRFSWFERLPLFGRQIMVTRPRDGASALAKKLRALGAQVIEFPTIATEPVTAIQGVEEMLAEKKKVCLTFTSPRGVDYFFEQLRQQQIDMRRLLALPGLTFAVLGPGTGKALRRYNIYADYIPETYCAQALGRLLAKSLDSQQVVYLFRAQKGAQSIVDILKEHQIPYRDIATYRTVSPEPAPLIEKVIEAFSQGDIDQVMFTSASTVRGFVEAFPEMELCSVRAVCIGEQTAAEAKKYGMQIRIAKEATLDSMVELLVNAVEATPHL